MKEYIIQVERKKEESQGPENCPHFNAGWKRRRMETKNISEEEPEDCRTADTRGTVRSKESMAREWNAAESDEGEVPATGSESP